MTDKTEKSPNWEHLLAMTEDELLLDLGLKLNFNSISALPHEDKNFRTKARLWIEAKRNTMCQSKRVFDACRNPDKVSLCAVVADVLGGAGAATAAVLCVKIGIETICKPLWNENGF